jgi:tRNA(adenine34) deaminase
MLDRLASWMDVALVEAGHAARRDEVPVGAVVVRDGAVIGRGFNQPVTAVDPTAHAEIVALRDAARAAGNYRLPGAWVVVTVEPCLMCLGALVHARIHLLVYGAPEPKAGAVLSAMHGLDHPRLNHRFAVVGGVREAECRDVLQDFFRMRRKEVPLRRDSP